MQTTLHVKGMSCGHCVSAIKDELKQLNGISAVEVNLSDGTVDITCDDTHITIEEIRTTIEDIGYDVVE
ncbi:copper chaperone CopZ [Virgibacillus sp. W0430]|uniref:copper chaperone CopZ n=1 Tax=Virgibacillus sp. W0430 TaxID=3391580 RepID=UPI003F4820DF